MQSNSFDDEFLKYIPKSNLTSNIQTSQLETPISFRSNSKLNTLKVTMPRISLLELVKYNVVYNHQLKVPILREEKRNSSFFGSFFTTTKNVQLVKMSDPELFQNVNSLQRFNFLRHLKMF
jgi:hypothetical protein